MATTFYAYKGRSFDAERDHFQEINTKEYYAGDLDVLSTGNIVDMKLQKGLSAPFPVNFFLSRSRLAFRRSWNHIRENHTDVCIIWFVNRGELSVTQLGKSCRVPSGQCVITRSNVPLRIEVHPDGDSVLEALHIVVPMHVMHGYIADGAGICMPFSAKSGECLVAQKVLSLLFAHGDTLSTDMTDLLISALLKAVGHSVEALAGTSPRRTTIGDKRMVDIESFITMHISDPDISSSFVARGCGISPRYLCYLLKAHGTSFSTVVWNKRLENAEKWLVQPNMKNHSIGEIAFMAGYKSAAHFSRMFKKKMNCSPREFRTRTPQAVAAE